jgi:hypothetical protein
MPPSSNLCNEASCRLDQSGLVQNVLHPSRPCHGTIPFMVQLPASTPIKTCTRNSTPCSPSFQHNRHVLLACFYIILGGLVQHHYTRLRLGCLSIICLDEFLMVPGSDKSLHCLSRLDIVFAVFLKTAQEYQDGEYVPRPTSSRRSGQGLEWMNI